MNIDTHVHLGGSIPVQFVWKTITQLGLGHLAETETDVQQQMTFSKSEEVGFHRFLNKFRILDEIEWSEELIDDSIKSVCDCLVDVDHALIDFSINKYMNIGWHKHEAIKFIYDRFQFHRPGQVSLILSIKYESMKASQRQYAKLIEDPIADCLVGIDLVGDEGVYDWQHWGKLIEPWVASKKMVRAHVGELGGEENISTAIDIGMTNIAHGIKITSEDLIRKAIDKNISFDLGLTSNYLTGVVTGDHPIRRMFDAGLKLTLGSDDPVTCSTTLSNEYVLAKKLGMTDAECDHLRQNAIDLLNRFSPNSYDPL